MEWLGRALRLRTLLGRQSVPPFAHGDDTPCGGMLLEGGSPARAGDGTGGQRAAVAGRRVVQGLSLHAGAFGRRRPP